MAAKMKVSSDRTVPEVHAAGRTSWFMNKASKSGNKWLFQWHTEPGLQFGSLQPTSHKTKMPHFHLYPISHNDRIMKHPEFP